ncbi:hypothetical protein TSUD_234180 [Trifolium subterraneum]|uniref:Amino acid transporter transmembrane domain-containing protein n=1 Tax=Trifolium subterraneum TaxID=3900 RepID=A0A2Z6ME99_TRISU|nr:hypothetical protein TSUD_234180 [Trifolium subterraneum]
MMMMTANQEVEADLHENQPELEANQEIQIQPASIEFDYSHYFDVDGRTKRKGVVWDDIALSSSASNRWKNVASVNSLFEFPRLYLISEQKMCNVMEMGELDGTTWRWNFRWWRRLFGWEAVVLEKLMMMLVDGLLTSEEDRWVWTHSDDGNFSVKFAYSLLAPILLNEDDRMIVDSFVFENIWKRTFWTATAHIITAVIGSGGVLVLAWAMAQLGWIFGPIVTIMFAAVNVYTSILLTHCYRRDASVTGWTNSYTYTDAVMSILGGRNVQICGLFQYLNICGIGIGFTIVASTSMMAIERSHCLHVTQRKDICDISSKSSMYMALFGVVELLLSHFSNLNQVSWLSIIATIMSLIYSGIGLGLGIAKVAENGTLKESLTGIRTDTITHTQQIWKRLQALGAIAFAYSFSIILIEIQVFSQPLLAFVENWTARRWSHNEVFTEYGLPAFHPLWRASYVVFTTCIAMAMPSFTDIIGILGAFGFWPLAVYFPITMYLSEKKIQKWTKSWVGHQMLNGCVLLISIFAAIGSIVGLFDLD